jgi:para-aminobenzoate synthetase component 1
MLKFFNQKDGFAKIASLGRKKEPFLFIISYNKSKIYASSLKSLDSNIKYSFSNKPSNIGKKSDLKKYPVSYKKYLESFNRVIENIKDGNTYLLNLTFKSKIETNLSLEDIFNQANAPYKLLIKDSFVCFSPECFIEIKNNTISTYPMKGTIDANILNAKEQILSNPKEMAEHTMIVDLMRNDLNIVAKETKVTNFRYIQKIKAGSKELLQVSSKIEAKLSNKWHEHLAIILDKLTPAGSISGTPKKKTLEIIDSVEPTKRGLYTGIFGIYDGNSLKSAVMIRAISKEHNNLFYYSGGGITLDSNPELEYQELVDKIYLPF